MRILVNRKIKRLFLCVLLAVTVFIAVSAFFLLLKTEYAIFCVTAAAVLLACSLFALMYRYFRDQSRIMNDAIDQIREYIDGNRNARIECDDEGDLYRLFHEVNTLVTILNAHAENEERAKTFMKDTISDISHQLRTPLAALNIYNGLLQEEVDGHPELREFTSLSEQELDRIESLNEHLNSSKWWDFGRKQGGLYVFTPTITADNGYWYRGTADAIYQNLDFLRRCHEPYVIITSGDAVYKMDYNKVLEYHIAKKADITVVCKELEPGEDATRFGTIRMNEASRIEEFEEKPMVAHSQTISTGIYIIRRRQLIDLIEHCAEEERHDFVTDILIRYKNLKKIYGYKINSYWSNISTVDAYYRTNMDFLKPEVRNYFFRELPSVFSKVSDQPPAKYNPGAVVKNSLVGSGSIINGTVENSVIFKKVFVGNNCVIKNSIILNDVYLGDNTYIENCIVESRDTIRANTRHVGENGVKIVVEKNERYAL